MATAVTASTSPAPSAPAAPTWPAAAGRGLSRAAQVGVMVGPFLSMLDGNVVNVAAVDIARQLDASLWEVGAAIFGYLLALAASLPATAWLARRFGTRRVYTVSLAAFGLASTACALAPNAGALVAFRVVQGFAGAPLLPLAMAVLFAGRNRFQMPAAMTLMLFLAPAPGPTARGLIVPGPGWRPVFLRNLPVAARG